MFGHLSGVLVVTVSGRENLLVGEILIVLYHLLVVLVGLGPLRAPVPGGPGLVGPRARPAGHPRRYPAQHRRRDRRGCTVTGLTVP